MKHSARSHCEGERIVPAALRKELAAALESLQVPIEEGASSKVRDEIVSKLRALGWSGELVVSQESKISITSMKGSTGLCLQTGNMARMYADLLKLQKLYLDNSIASAVMIVPSEPVAKALGANLAHATRLERELTIFKKVVHVPMVIYAIE